jgi:hypothetical protein
MGRGSRAPEIGSGDITPEDLGTKRNEKVRHFLRMAYLTLDLSEKKLE